MNSFIIVLIDRIEDEAIRGAVTRLYNNAVAFILSSIGVIGGYASVYFISNGFPESLSDFVSTDLWEYISVMVIMGMLGIASVKKATRVSHDIRDIGDEG